MGLHSIVEEYARRVARERAKILDNFIEVYMAGRADYFGKGEIDWNRIQIVEDMTDPKKIVYSVRLKPGRPKKQRFIIIDDAGDVPLEVYKK